MPACAHAEKISTNGKEVAYVGSSIPTAEAAAKSKVALLTVLRESRSALPGELVEPVAAKARPGRQDAVRSGPGSFRIALLAMLSVLSN